VGLSLSTSGDLSGSPTLTGGCSGCSWTFTVQVRDSGTQTASQQFWMVIVDVLQIASTTFYPGNVAVPYSAFVFLSGGLPPYTWALAAGSTAPPGLKMETNGVIDGTPTAPGTFNFDVEAKDSSATQQTARATCTLRIENQLVFVTTSLPTGYVGEAYQQTIRLAGGTPPYSMSVAYGPPPGLVFDGTTGVISGTPTQGGSYFSIGITATDSSTPPQSKSTSYSFWISPLLYFETTRMPDGVKGAGYDASISVGGGKEPYTLTLVSGALPPGLSFGTAYTNQSLHVVGTPTTVGDYPITIEATESSTVHSVVRQDLTIRVNTKLVLNTANLPEGLEGQSYDFTLSASDGVPPYRWYAFCIGPKTGCVPGLSLDQASGHISGLPTQEFKTTYYITLQDSSNPPQEVRQNLVLNIVGLLRVTSRLPALAVGSLVQIGLATSGGTPPFTWSLLSGTLPAGLSFDPATVRISGTPTGVERQSVAVKVADSGTSFPQSIQQSLTLDIVASPGRNDTIGTATPLSNGTYKASISPVDDGSPAVHPDNDYYAITANPGAVVSVEITAERLTPPSPMDSVIEIVDNTGARFGTCDAFGYGAFYQPCMNDDNQAVATLDSKLYFQVPGTPGGAAVTFYVRVLDWSGMARPDFVYTITISGAN
jgi:hypothetical protein